MTLLKAGIFVGGCIIAGIAAIIVSLVSEEDGPETRPGNADNTSTEVPSPRSTSTKLPETRINLESKTTTTGIDSGIQHKKKSPPPSSSSETTARRRTLQKSHEEVSQNQPKVLPPSPSPSPIHTFPRQTSGTHKTTAQTLPHDDQSPSSCKPSPSLEVPHRLSSSKPTLPVAPSDPTNPQAKASYILVQEEGTSPIFPTKGIDSGIQHQKKSPPPSSSSETTARRRTLQKTSPPSPPPPSSPSTSPSPTHTVPRQTSGSHKTTAQTLPHRPSFKPTLSVAPSDPTNPQAKTSYILGQEGTSPVFPIPEDLKDLFKKDVVPGILKKPLSPSTYKDYFDALLYAEDYYIEKWDGFEMKNVTLELHEAEIYKRKDKFNNWNVNEEKDDKVFVAFEMDTIPERRPFLLSRDFVSVRPSGTKTEPIQGLIYRVLRSNLVLAEFGEDFHSRHYSACKYDVKFSFNRVCLKRAHQAIAAASDPLFRNFLFPDCILKNSIVAARFQSINPNLDQEQFSAVRQILSHQNPLPYLMEGQISVEKSKQLSRTGLVVSEAVLQIYRIYPSCRILICTPTNSRCDVITRSLKKEIPEFDIFRANAAFRELDGVPFDILPNCLYKGECFSCPSLQELRNFKVILSTYMSSFRLHNEGIMAGHFSHIFLVDGSSTTEPETMVALANLANERTAVTITGAPRNHSGWVHSNIARQNGLMTSYFERLRESKLYKSLDSKVITQLKDLGQKSNDTYSSLSFR